MAALLECSLHGVENSTIAAHPCPCFCKSCMDESDRQYNLRMAEYTRQIQESCATILQLLKEEIEASESSTVHVLEDSPFSMDPIEEHYVVDEAFGCLKEAIDASEVLNVALPVSKDFLPSKESTYSPFVIDENSVIHRISPRREVQLTQILESSNDPISVSTEVAAARYTKMEEEILTTSLVHDYPFDPGPVDSAPLVIESNTHDSIQLDDEVSTRIPSQGDNSITLQMINMLRKNSVRDAKVLNHAFILPFYDCHIVNPLIPMGGFFDFGTSSSHTYQVFVERPLKTTFSWNIVLFHYMNTIFARLQISSQMIKLSLGNVLFACNTSERLLFGTQGPSLVQRYSHILLECNTLSFGYAFELSAFALGMVKIVDNVYGSCWRLIQLEIVVDGMIMLERLLTNKVQLFAIVEVFLYMRYGHIITCKILLYADDCAANSLVSIICNGTRDTSIPVANFGVEGDHVLEAAVNCFIERRKLIHNNYGILIVILLGDESLVAALKLRCENEKDILRGISQTILLTSVHQNMVRLICCDFNFASSTLVLFQYPTNTTLEMRLLQCIRQYLELDWCIKLIFVVETSTGAFFLYEKPSINMCHNIKSSCILSKADFYVIMARLGLLYCVVTSELQWYMISYRTNMYDMCVVILKIISGSNYLGYRTLDLCKRAIGKLEESVDPLPLCYFISEWTHIYFESVGAEGKQFGIVTILCIDDKFVHLTFNLTGNASLVLYSTQCYIHYNFLEGAALWDPGGSGKLFHNKGSLQFKAWDPGGECSLVYVEGPLDHENYVESCCYQFTPLP